MKRFIASIIVSIVLITAGTVTLFFELTDFNIVENDDYNLFDEDNMKIYTLYTDTEDVRIETDNTVVEWRYDESMKQNEVKVAVSPFLSVKQRNNRFEVDDFSLSFKGIKKAGEHFLEGLKNKEIRTYRHDQMGVNKVIITCSRETSRLVHIDD